MVVGLGMRPEGFSCALPKKSLTGQFDHIEDVKQRTKKKKQQTDGNTAEQNYPRVTRSSSEIERLVALLKGRGELRRGEERRERREEKRREDNKGKTIEQWVDSFSFGCFSFEKVE